MAPQKTKTFTLRELDAAVIMLEMTGETTYTEADVEAAVQTLKDSIAKSGGPKMPMMRDEIVGCNQFTSLRNRTTAVTDKIRGTSTL
ncbi:hypothetical protein COCCADRAFT_7746 [Bipolaris zeicola 26-R-13]|uniref:Uncharacterized protein n=1 Tax=Cochliobolus carbonum (strain 26-R-13) TaxID=930089 RepID=W6YFY2_COCC2|nr:uncharacterized protein COCCADRAFT_7746 [Bipolaris zeicola 26-R-13]EUC30136.1 hypothetical protein COCCADRAFT_7746 [Bipolaris zeicola 26-R-13]